MAVNLSQAVTDTPTALASIDDDTTYVLQNKGFGNLFVEVAAAAPSVGSAPSTVVEPLSGARAKAESGESIYVWAESRDGVVSYGEEP